MRSLPVVDEKEAEHGGKVGTHSIYAEEEALEAFPDLFSAVGMPNVRELE